MTVIRVELDEWRPARPGQFALLQVKSSARFLPRAFSVMDQSDQEAGFLIAPIGPATEELAGLRAGQRVWVLGPVGRGFDLPVMLGSGRGDGPPLRRRVVIVAGGVGLAPFPLLLQELARPGWGCAENVVCTQVLILAGFRDAAQARAMDLLEEPLSALRRAGMSARAEVITEDGGLGRAGLVTDLVGEELLPGDVLAVCGSEAMCEAVWSLCARAAGGAGVTAGRPAAWSDAAAGEGESEVDMAANEAGGRIDAWFSMEAPMACGVGSCQGCVIPVSGGGLVRVCRHGPVFEGREVFGMTAEGS